MTKIRTASYLFIFLMLAACGSDQTDLSINFKLENDGGPLVFFEDIQYPDGRSMQMTKVSFYLSQIELVNDTKVERLSEVEFVDLTEAQLLASTAEEGTTISYSDIEIEDFGQLRFNVGLTETQNNTVPGDYNSGDALGMSGEYWTDWNSYIFIKLEGKLDFDQNGSYDAGENIVLHLGTSEITNTKSVNIDESQSTVNFVIDIQDVFNSAEHGLYDIDSKKTLHQLTDENIEFMTILASNLTEAIKLNN